MASWRVEGRLHSEDRSLSSQMWLWENDAEKCSMELLKTDVHFEGNNSVVPLFNALWTRQNTDGARSLSSLGAKQQRGQRAIVSVEWGCWNVAALKQTRHAAV